MQQSGQRQRLENLGVDFHRAYNSDGHRVYHSSNYTLYASSPQVSYENSEARQIRIAAMSRTRSLSRTALNDRKRNNVLFGNPFERMEESETEVIQWNSRTPSSEYMSVILLASSPLIPFYYFPQARHIRFSNPCLISHNLNINPIRHIRPEPSLDLFNKAQRNQIIPTNNGQLTILNGWFRSTPTVSLSDDEPNTPDSVMSLEVPRWD